MPRSRTLICSRVLELPSLTDLVQAVMRVLGVFWVWAAAKPGGIVIAMGPTVTAWAVLTAYDHYAEFIPDLKSSEILGRAGETAIVHQKGEAGFFLFHFPMEVTFSVTERPPSEISSRAISGTFKEMTSAYTLAQDGSGVSLSYSGRLVPDFLLPPLIGTAAVKAAVEKQFGALVKEIQRRGALRVAPAQ